MKTTCSEYHPCFSWRIPEDGSHMLPCNAVSEYVVQFSEKAKHSGKPDGNASRPSADPPRGTCLSAIGLSTKIVQQFSPKEKKKEMYNSSYEQHIELHWCCIHTTRNHACSEIMYSPNWCPVILGSMGWQFFQRRTHPFVPAHTAARPEGCCSSFMSQANRLRPDKAFPLLSQQCYRTSSPTIWGSYLPLQRSNTLPG